MPRPAFNPVSRVDSSVAIPTHSHVYVKRDLLILVILLVVMVAALIGLNLLAESTKFGEVLAKWSAGSFNHYSSFPRRRESRHKQVFCFLFWIPNPDASLRLRMTQALVVEAVAEGFGDMGGSHLR